ncbi:hypothetical protein PHJA_001495500 [Phtheirospermum japonicum]|uniref:Uncharacterized protein n=1 Tax=Phtheirospermum japonicum TaxID=374723 RepID=A0A830CGR3_9LAMI|nr:hypothetical protein PHJA_001495500 [Phtheirospermum japonicum]
MVVILLKLVLFVLSMLSNVLAQLVFTIMAQIVVHLIQALKVSGDASQHFIEQVKNVIRSCLEYLLDVVIEMITTLLSSLFDIVKEGVLTSSSGLAGVVAGLVEKSKTSLDNFLQDVPEVLEALIDMVGKIVTDLWNNCNDAVSYVTENVLN